MKCPVPCQICEEVVELAALHFRSICECHPDDTCEHGICDECLDEFFEDEVEDDEL